MKSKKMTVSGTVNPVSFEKMEQRKEPPDPRKRRNFLHPFLKDPETKRKRERR
jgi:hypothetical protein